MPPTPVIPPVDPPTKPSEPKTPIIPKKSIVKTVERKTMKKTLPQTDADNGINDALLVCGITQLILMGIFSYLVYRKKQAK